MRRGLKSVIIIIASFIVGLSLVLYPAVADYWNNLHQSKAVSQYAEDVANMDKEVYKAMLDAAADYNARLLAKADRFNHTAEDLAEYNSLLNVAGNGIMGYVEIPAIGVSLPIYHGTDSSVLQIAIGHIDWSSLPVSGKGVHSVISGHRGLSTARLFTDLDKLEEGDIFVIRVLDEMYTYEIDTISVVLPNEVTLLGINSEMDLFSLVTCTPYGINTHRLIVRGHRVENNATSPTVKVTSDAIKIDPVLMSPIFAVPILILWLMMPVKPKNH